ncbi:hypothetical protein FCR2A7T_09720 [Flavobacterium cauense R2A-7]|uniref:Uncharacterized protein n=1 Tax=Flavobacterium cauense R2A-7 TaxID=1341154 RepID=V6S2Q2_9FLAO|nr:hypothetical protein [Flavobacterium cauense]ESU20664.1 hypothetical protein FCR2A7T_09720 [Flavobacterium cauense R2A-7]KGO82959.1 hypothetical protein Q762_04200 [Flavobacterium cauense R2A-7]TWI10761.1 hypothetical protein IP98_02110 [Flavobacterium cauense R2A-7]
MHKFTLEILFQIIGIGSASGLIYKDNQLFIIGDNSSYLYEYDIDNKELKRHPLTENPSENIAKKDKPDFEAITEFDGKTYIFGSGSTENRNKMVTIDSKSKEIIATTDLSDLYLAMQSFAELPQDDLNIEGAAFNGSEWFFFNRGNGAKGKNIVFTVQGKNLTEEFNIISTEFKLPKLKGIRSSFTDAVVAGNKMYFLATAENTTSTYNDGEVAGSVIGCIDLETMKIDFTKKITETHKFEGLTLYKETNKEISFLLCEDNDTEELKATIFKLSLKK